MEPYECLTVCLSLWWMGDLGFKRNYNLNKICDCSLSLSISIVATHLRNSIRGIQIPVVISVWADSLLIDRSVLGAEKKSYVCNCVSHIVVRTFCCKDVTLWQILSFNQHDIRIKKSGWSISVPPIVLPFGFLYSKTGVSERSILWM